MAYHYDRPGTGLASQIAEAMANPCDPATKSISADNGSTIATLRLFGGHVVEGRVWSPSTHAPVELLYPGENVSLGQLRNPKIRASHFGAPVGLDGFNLGGKHGAARWMKFDVQTHARNSIIIDANLDDVAGIMFAREVTIQPDRIEMVDYFGVSSGEKPEQTSMVNHLYLHGGNTPLSEAHITIDGNTLDDTLGESGATASIMEDGQPRFWSGFSDVGSAVIGMPDGHHVRITADYNDDRVSGALLWAPPGENAFCFEPVVGLSADLKDNRCLEIPAGGVGALAVSVIAM